MVLGCIVVCVMCSIGNSSSIKGVFSLDCFVLWSVTVAFGVVLIFLVVVLLVCDVVALVVVLVIVLEVVFCVVVFLWMFSWWLY